VPDAQLTLPTLATSAAPTRSSGPSYGWDWANFAFGAVLLTPGTYYFEVHTEPAGYGSATVQKWTGGLYRTTGGAYSSLNGGPYERDPRSDFNYQFTLTSVPETSPVMLLLGLASTTLLRRRR